MKSAKFITSSTDIRSHEKDNCNNRENYVGLSM